MAVNESDVILTICSGGHGKSPVGEEESQELKVEAYRVLASHLKQSSSNLLPQLLVKFQEILPLTLSDAGAAKEVVAIAALKFLSSCLFDQSLANSAQAEVVVPVLCELALRQQSSSEVITHLLWCLNDHKMNCSPSLLTTHVKVQVLMISQLIMSQKHSFTVEAECMNLLHRLYKDYEEAFVQLDPMMWYPSLVTLLTGDHEQNIKEAYQLVHELQPLVAGNSEVAGLLVESLKEKSALALYKQFINKKIEQTTLLIWQHFVYVLDRELHNYGNWFNSFLKIVEQAFKHSNIEIQIAAYKAWRCLIENYALNIRILIGSRRMKLIMTPLAGFPTQSRHEQVDVERFTVWQYLIEQLGSKRSHCVKQVITPLLLFSVGIDSRLSNVVLDEWALDGACLSITPTTATSESGADNTTEVFITIICHHGDDKSVISSPRIHPGIVYHSVLLSCCQLVMSLCGRPPAKQVAKAVVPVINCGDDKAIFLKQPRTFLLFVEAILQLFPIVSNEVCHNVWQAVFHCVTVALTDPGILSATPLVLPMISILRIALKNKKLQQLSVVIVTELCHLYHKVPFKLSSSDQMFVLSSLSNKKVLPWQFLLETILHHPVLLQKIEMVAMITVLKFCFANVKDFVNNASSIIDMLKLLTPSNKQHRWLLFDVWNNLISIITEKVSKVGKLLEDNSAECNALLCDLLVYPVELLYVSVALARAVPIEVRAKLIPAWTKLIEAIAMVTTSESTNYLVAIVLNKLVELIQEQNAEIYMLCALTKICLSSIVHVNFTKGDPSKVIDAHLKLVKWILVKTSQSEKLQQEAMTTSLFSGLVDVTIKIFTLLRGTELVLSGLDYVIPYLTDIFNQLHKRFNGDRSSLYASLRKVWSAIATCLQARYTGGYSSELLVMLSPMLILMLSLRDRGRHNNSLCSHMLTFWCATFAKEATLVYPDKLCDALKEFRHMGGRIELPGWPEDEKIVTVIADSLNGHEENSLDLMDSQTKALPSTSTLQNKGKNYLRARRKLPLDHYNNENVEASPVTKKKRLLSRYQKSFDTPKLYKSLERHSTQSNKEHSSIDEISQSDESPAIPVPMVIACEVNHDERVDVTDDDSLLFDSNTPISMIPISNSHFSISNSESQASIETEQDSVSTIPETADYQMSSMEQDDVNSVGVVNGNHNVGEIPSSEDITTCDNNSCNNVSNSPSHLLDHSYTTLQNGGGVVSSHEKLWCDEKIASMITPISKKSVITLFKDNGCHAARCSAIKRSNRTLARVRRHQRQITPLSLKKSRKKNWEVETASNKRTCARMERPVQELIPSSQAETSSCNDNLTNMVKSGTKSVDLVAKDHNVELPQLGETVNSIDTVTKPMVTVTQPVVTVSQAMVTVPQPVVSVTQPMVTIPQPVVTVTQPRVTATQPVVTVTQPLVTETQPVVTVTQPMVTVSQPVVSVTQPIASVTHAVLQSVGAVKESNKGLEVTANSLASCTQSCSVTNPKVTTHRKDSVTDHIDTVTQLMDTTTCVQQSQCTMTQDTSHTNGVGQHSRDDVRAAVVRSNLQLLQYNHLMKQLAIKTMSTTLLSKNSSQLPCSNQLQRGPSVSGANKMACLYNMLSSCLMNAEMNVSSPVPATCHAGTSHHFPLSSNQFLPVIHNVFSNANTSRYPFTNHQLPGIIRQRHTSSTFTAKPLITAATTASNLCPVNSPCLQLDSMTTSSVVNSASVTIPVSVSSSVLSSAKPSIRPIQVESSVTSVNPSVPFIASVNSSVTSVTSRNSPSVTSLTSVDSLNVLSSGGFAMSVGSNVMSLTSVSSSNTLLTSSVACLTSVNSSSIISLALNNSGIASVASINSNLTSVNSNVKSVCSSVAFLTSVNSQSVTSLTSVDSSRGASVNLSSTSVGSSVTSLTSVNSPLTSNNSSVASVTSLSSPSITSLASNNSLSVALSTSINSPSIASSTSVDSGIASLASVNSLNATSANSNVKSSMSFGSSVTFSTSVDSPNVTFSTSANSTSVTSLTSVNSSSVVSLSVDSTSVTSLMSVDSSSVTSLTSVNSSVTSLTSVNSSSVTSVNSLSVTSLTSVNSPGVTSFTSVNSSSVTSISSPSVTFLTSVDSISVASLTSVNSSITSSISDKSSPVPSIHTGSVKNADVAVNSITSISLETIPLATASESVMCNYTEQSGNGIDSPPHTPTGGILKRVSQFDTPNTSGKRRRVSFADTVENYNDVYSDRRYITSPRSKLHSKVSPRRLLPKPDKINSMGKTKSALQPNVDDDSLPTYPSLRSCDAPVDIILPDLISSPMARSLGKLFHARDIRTVGHLASLPENQVKLLPIQQPKLKTLKSTLELFEKQLEQSNSKIANGDKSLPSSRGNERVPTAMELPSLDHVITPHDHVSLDDITTTSDEQISLVEPLTTPSNSNDSDTSSHATTSNTTSVTMATVDQHLDTPTCGSGLEIPNRMQYLTESCSYDNSNDNLILATPESQSVKEDEQVDLLATANNNTTICSNEDPLVIAVKTQAPNDEGNPPQDDTTAVSSRMPQSRITLHNHLQAIAARKFPQILTEFNNFLKFLEDCHLDNSDLELAVSVIIDGLDHMLANHSSP